jgi:hypothetical protein
VLFFSGVANVKDGVEEKILFYQHLEALRPTETVRAAPSGLNGFERLIFNMLYY